MKSIFLKLAALAITASMLFAFASCGNETTTEAPTTTEARGVATAQTTEPAATEVPTETETVAETSDTSTAPAQVSPVDDDAAALQLYNDAANDVKISKPALHKERGTEFIGFEEPSEFLSGLVNSTGVIPKDDNLDFPAGTDYTDWFPPIGESWASKLTLDDLKDISCTDNGNTYTIELTIVKSEIPTSMTDYTTTPVGRGMAINSTEDLKAGAAAVGELTGCDQIYDNCTITAVIDKATGKMQSATHVLNFQIRLTGKLVVTLNDFAVTLRITENYKMTY